MSTSQGAPEAGATTPLDDHVARALELMASGEWRLILEHPNPAKGSTFFDLDLTKEIARRAPSPSPPPGVGEPKYEAVQSSDDPAERLAYDLAVELEQADLDRNDYVTVNRAKLLAIAKRSIARAAPPVGVGVVKLKWEPYPNPVLAGPDVAVAKSIMSHKYQVQRDPWAPTYVAYLHPALPITDSTLWWESKGHATIDEAKSAAQADFERRIRSALVPSPLLKEAEEALRRQGPRFKIRQLGEIEFKGCNGEPKHIHGLVLEALTDDDVRAAGSLLGQVVTVGGAS